VWLQGAQFTVYTVLVLFLLALGFLWPRMFISIPPGSRGVMYRYFSGGTVTDRPPWGEGLNVIAPWDTLTIYETRIQQHKLRFDVLSEEGLDLGLEVAIRYRPNIDALGELHQDIGTDYFDRLIRPEVESHVRLTFGRRPAHEIYSSARDLVQELGKVSPLGRSKDGKTLRYVEVLEVKLIDIELPSVVEGAIAEKYRQEQLMLEYRYKLEREEKEAQRKRTEAAGIRDYNAIASRVSPDLLRWRSIDATLELAKSPNTKVVVLGGTQGAQVLMNVDAPMGGAAAPLPAADAGKAPENNAPVAPPALPAPGPAPP
jgi:regulator of protease activity HflC (stomatin/prohibitin superfamily)